MASLVGVTPEDTKLAAIVSLSCHVMSCHHALSSVYWSEKERQRGKLR